MKNKVGTAIVTAAIGALGSTSTSFAADWQITPYLNVAEIYTDDVNLDAAFAQSDFVTQTTVGTRIDTTGPRFNLNLDYGLTHLFYPSLSGDKDEFRHNLQATAGSELVRDFVFIDFNASMTEQFIDRRAAFSTVSLARTTNRGTLSIIDVSPYTVNRINGNFATLTNRYRYSYIDLSRNITLTGVDLGESSAQFHEVSSTLASGTRFTKFTWSWANSFRRERGSNTTDNDIYTSLASGDYQWTRQIAFIGQVGFLKRNSDFAGGTFSGVIWRAGGRLTPGPRTVLTATYGKEFYGNTFNFSGSYRLTDRIDLTVNYFDRYSSFQDIALNNVINGDNNPSVPVQQDVINNNFNRQKQWNAGIVGVRGRSTIGVSASYSKNTSNDVASTYIRRAIGIDWTRRLSPRLSFNAAANLMEDDFFTDPGKDVFIAYSGRFDYTISQNITGTIEYIHTKRNQLFFNYVPRMSNYVSVAIGVTF
ncbi:MAG: TIGR03016 family PEP-CTERM system-associated outer membrane protein [Emcibacteraceae bacterium]